MPFTLISTYGSMAANTYAAVADADTFITGALVDPSPWATAAPRQIAALCQATRDIDAYAWHGTRYFYRQALAFPRVPPGVTFGDATGSYGPGVGSVESDVSFFNFLLQDQYLQTQWTRVQNACALQAVFVLRNDGRNLDREAQQQGITAQSTGRAGISESYAYQGVAHRLSFEALDLLRSYRASKRVVRGSGPDPLFD